MSSVTKKKVSNLQFSINIVWKSKSWNSYEEIGIGSYVEMRRIIPNLVNLKF